MSAVAADRLRALGQRLGKEHPRASRIAAGVVAFLIFFTAAGFLIAPPLLRPYLERKLSETLHRRVGIREIAINPYALSASVRGFSVKEKDGRSDFLSFQELYVNLEAVSAVKGGPVLREIRLRRPYINVVRSPDGRYNFSDIIDAFASKPKTDGKPTRFSLNNIQIDNGAVNFWDGPMNRGHAVREMAVRIPFVSNLPYDVKTFIQPLFQARINGDAVRVAGRTKPFEKSLESIVDLNVADLDVPRYVAYSPVQPAARLVSARLDTTAELSFARHPDKPPTMGLKGTFTLRKVAAVDRDGRPMVAFPRLGVVVESSDLITSTFRFSSVVLESPQVAVRLGPEGRINLADFAATKRAGNVPGREAAKKGEGKVEKINDNTSISMNKSKPGKALVEAGKIEVRNGKVTFEDRADGRRFDTVLDNISVTVSPFTTAPGKDSKILLGLRTEKGERVTADGRIAADPVAFDGAVTLKGIVLKKYAPYYENAVLCDVASGTADVGASLKYATGDGGGGVSATGISVDLASLSLRRRGDTEEFLKIPVFTVRNASVDTAARDAVLGAVSTRKGVVALRRNADGTINVASLTPPPAPRAKAPAPGSSAGAGTLERPWTVSLTSLRLDGYAVRWSDGTTSPPAAVTFDPVRVTAENLTTRKGGRGKASVALKLGGGGSVSVQGPVGLRPASADLRVDIRDVPVASFQPYFADKVRIAVTDGVVAANGTLSVAAPEGKELRGRYKGEAGIYRLASLDKENSENFLSWEALHAGGIDAVFSPFGLSVEEIALSSFTSRIVVNADGTLNVQGVVSKKAGSADNAAVPAAPKAGAAEPAGAAPGAAPGPPPSVRIGKVTLQGGTISFADRHVKPGYAAVLNEIGGRISGLSSDETARAEVDLRGTYEGSAPLEITGRINPLSRELYADLKVEFRDMDLSPLTPYSGRYAGYAIERGKLSLGLSYLIVARKLESQNVVRIDRFDFGERVESPDATKLPVRLAVALLKDRSGEIRLDLPVSGSLDDPKFSVWRIVVKIIMNLLVKAATSPFALLGALFGGGEELSYVEYDPGSHAFTGATPGKIATLVKALRDRPALKVDIAGHVDVERDREALRQETFRRKVRAQKLKVMLKEGKTGISPDNVVVEPAEYPRYLALAYKEEKFPKPRNIIGIARTLPVPEMEKLMLTNIVIGEDDLRQLAQRRAAAVRDALLGSKQVEAERVFLVEPKSLPPEKKEKVRDSRVDFVLK